jgi:hypothetical protein
VGSRSNTDTTALANETYKLVPEFESEQRVTQVNLTEVVEDPNQSSEEILLRKASPRA